ncbi:MAG: hypothetical protein AB7I41_08360 [Candidatus Sericytochromatia bacterium]
MKTNVIKIAVSGLMLSLTVSACMPIIVQVGPNRSQSGSQNLNAKQISGYLMRVAATFKVQAVNDLHAQLIQENVKAFENDLSQGQLDDYYKLPDFSIQLLAHSEGSYFTSPGNLNEFTNSDAAFARALVIYPDQSYDIFKGQFANQRFYFSGAESLPANNTSYLITLDKELKTRVVTGQLEGQSPTATPSPAASPVILPSPEALPLPAATASTTANPVASNGPLPSLPPTTSPPPGQRFSSAIAQYRSRLGGFNQQIQGFLPGPPPPPPPAARGQFAPPPGAPPLPNAQPPNGPPPQGQPPLLIPPEVMDRLRQERPSVLAAIEALAGLPPQEHYAAMQKIQAANADLIPELGPPPPTVSPSNPPPPRSLSGVEGSPPPGQP